MKQNNKLKEVVAHIQKLTKMVNQTSSNKEDKENKEIENILKLDLMNRSLDNIQKLEKVMYKNFNYFHGLRLNIGPDKQLIINYRYRGVISELQIEYYEPNSIVFQINEIGRKIYFILSGELVVLVEKKHFESYEPKDHYAKLLNVQFPNLKPVTTFTKGSYFGEVSLLHRVPRTATILTKTRTKLITFNFDTFNKYIGTDSSEVLYQKCKDLLKSSLFEDWQEHHIQKITYYTGQYIYREGSTDAYLYIVIDGQVKLEKVFNNTRKALSSIVAPDYFGDYELADIDEKSNFEIPKRQISALSVNVSKILKIDLMQYLIIAHQYCAHNKDKFLGIHHTSQNLLDQRIKAQRKIYENYKEQFIDLNSVMAKYIQSDKSSKFKQQFQPMTLRQHFITKKESKSNSVGNDFEIDLIEKFSFAIPFREDPLCNPRNIIRSQIAKVQKQKVKKVENKDQLKVDIEQFRKDQEIKLMNLPKKDQIKIRNRFGRINSQGNIQSNRSNQESPILQRYKTQSSEFQRKTRIQSTKSIRITSQQMIEHNFDYKQQNVQEQYDKTKKSRTATILKLKQNKGRFLSTNMLIQI